MIAALAAIPAGLLPSRWWDAFPSIQIRRFATLSALSTMAAGIVLGIPGFFQFLETDIIRHSPQVTALAPIVFVLTTPTGLFSFYLVLSGIFRAAAAYADDPYGDPLLTLFVAAVIALNTRRRVSAARAGRLRLEGEEVPDRLYRGEWAGLPQADFVVVASRRKEGWEPGVFVITPEQWYRLGVPFEMTLPGGLRTIYPLTALETAEVLRKGVAYDLPPLRKTRGG